MPAFSMAENSALATARSWASRLWGLAKTGGPGCVRRWWQGGEAVKPLEGRTSGISEKRLEMHFGAERRLAWRKEDGGDEEISVTE